MRDQPSSLPSASPIDLRPMLLAKLDGWEIDIIEATPAERQSPVLTLVDRPTIEVRRGDLPGMVRAAEKALLAAGSVFVMGSRLVRVHRGRRDDAARAAGIRHPDTAPTLADVAQDWLRLELARVARFVSEGKDGKPRETYPPPEVVRALAARGEWAFPGIDQVVEHPVLRPDGTVAIGPGYDARARAVIEPLGEPVQVPEVVSHREAQDAARTILEVFSEFPFTSPDDRAVAVAALLTIIARPAIAGPCPLFAITATSPASGKGLLVSALARIACGHDGVMMSAGRDGEETRKRITSLAQEGAALVILDNLTGPLGDGALAAALTASEWGDRVLGETRMVRAPMRAVWLATGNNVSFAADVGRRALMARLDPGCPHPEDRVFREQDLIGAVTRRRAELLSAALRVLVGFQCAGRPQHRAGARMGSFERWDDLVRSCVLWLELDALGDPCGTRAAVRATADQDLEDLRALLLAWSYERGNDVMTMRALCDEAGTHAHHRPELRDALLAFDARSTDRLVPKQLGAALRHHLGRWVATSDDCSMRLVSPGKDRTGVVLWQLEVATRS